MIPVMEFWRVITVLGYLLTFFLIPWVLLTKKNNPASTIAWILAIVALPIFGGLLFIVFGINRVRRRAAYKQRATSRIAPLLPIQSDQQLIPGESEDPFERRLMRLATRVAGTVPTVGNRIEILNDTNRTMGLIEQAILSAKQSLHLEYYIWQPDITGTHLRDRLIEKAREGVKIRFLYDAIGSLFLTRSFLDPMRQAGIEVAVFLPGRSWAERWSINLRSHRKLVIVDGQTGFTGGVNIGDEYLGRDPSLGYWRDTHLKLQGPVVLQLQQIFAEDWYHATGNELIDADLFPVPNQTGRTIGQAIAAGPDRDIAGCHALMFAAINDAQHRVHLATSYFVPTPPLVTALETAAYRGVKVRLLLSGRSAHFWTILAGRSYYQSLLEAGIEIYEYTRGLMHAKTLTVDGGWSLVGSPNFDARSLLLNFEVAVAMYDESAASQLESHFEQDLAHARRIELADWYARPIHHVLPENFCRLFAPVL